MRARRQQSKGPISAPDLPDRHYEGYVCYMPGRAAKRSTESLNNATILFRDLRSHCSPTSEHCRSERSKERSIGLLPEQRRSIAIALRRLRRETVSSDTYAVY